MAAATSIQWTDKTWNPVRGCSVVSPGCVNCYAMKQAHRFSGPGKPYEGLTKQTKAGPQWTGIVRPVESVLLEPLSWRKPCRVFVNSMSDLFHEAVPDEFIDKVFAVMALAPEHTFQILTKRVERMRFYLDDHSGDLMDRIDEASTGFGACHATLDHPRWPLPNVWLGASVEDQPRADERIDDLVQTRAAVRFLSCEPLLSDLKLAEWLSPSAFRRCLLHHHRTHHDCGGGGDSCDCEVCKLEWRDGVVGIHWVIVGGESGPGARPCDLAWVRSIVSQCKAASVACFVKQLGSRPDGWWTNELGPRLNRRALMDRKGGDPSEWPDDLRVREFPCEARD